MRRGSDLLTSILASLGPQQQPLSRFEREQQRLQRRIKALEQANVAAKPWQLMGEVGSSARPENALLEEVVDFDRVVRAPPG